MEKFYSIRETAILTGMKVRTVRDWICKGKIKAGKIEPSKKWLISEKEVERIRAKRKTD